MLVEAGRQFVTDAGGNSLFEISPSGNLSLLATFARVAVPAGPFNPPFAFSEPQADPARDFHPEFKNLTADAAVSRLIASIPDREDLVVCHGDYCVPNILLNGTRVAGYVDLGELSVADRWWDLAVATWSLSWNFGPGYEDLFLHSYGVRRDDNRTQFYRLLYDLVS